MALVQAPVPSGRSPAGVRLVADEAESLDLLALDDCKNLVDDFISRLRIGAEVQLGNGPHALSELQVVFETIARDRLSVPQQGPGPRDFERVADRLRLRRGRPPGEVDLHRMTLD